MIRCSCKNCQNLNRFTSYNPIKRAQPNIPAMKYNVRNKYYNLFEEAPVASAILDASNLQLEMVNQSMLDLWQRPVSIKGTSLLEFLPELADQEYPQLLKRVIKTRSIHKEAGALVLLDRHKKLESVYMDYSYTPISMQGGRTTAILVMATDICEREINRLNILQSKRDLRALVMSAPVPMCIYRDTEFKVEAVNNFMLDLWQNDQTMNLAALNHVFHNGVPYSLKQNGVTYNYTPLRSGSKSVDGVCVIAVKH